MAAGDMLERVNVNGREGTAAYLTGNFEPADKATATMIKIVFDDGDVLFAVPEGSEPQFTDDDEATKQKQAEWAATKAEAEALLEEKKVDFIQDPATGRLMGSHSQGGDESWSGPREPKDLGKYRSDPTSASTLLPEDQRAITMDEAKAETDRIIASLGATEMIADVRARLKAGTTTAKLYKKPDGSWAKERHPEQDRVANEVLTKEMIDAARPKPGEQPVLHIIGGRGGSGKGWFSSGQGTFDVKNKVVMDNDKVKDKMREYDGWNAALVYEESSDIGDALERFALRERLHTVIDGTLKDSPSTIARIETFKAAGYRIEGHYMYLSPKKAAERALTRYIKGVREGGTGRYVPPEYTMTSNTNEHNFDVEREKMDYWEVYTNEKDNATPQLHSRKQ